MEIPIHVIDFEGNRQRGIVEWGVVSVQGQKILETRTQCCPSFFLPNEMPPDCVDFKENASYFLQLRRTGIFCAHSCHVEDALLRHYWASPGYVPNFTSPSTVTTWGPWLDSCAIWMRLMPHLKAYGLMDLIRAVSLSEHLRAEVIRYCPKGRDHRHAALHDALASSLLWRHAMRCAPGKILEDWVFYSHFRTS
jgi:DNA polymerase-3 subunit epsilon